MSTLQMSMFIPRLKQCALIVALLCIGGCTVIVSPYTKPPAVPPTPVSLLAYGYVANSRQNTISMHTISSAGLWNSTVPPNVETGDDPESLFADPSGRYVYVTNARENTISQYAINTSDGTLTALQPATVSTGLFPQYVTEDPLGRFVYTADTNGNTISMFMVDSSTGRLSPTNPATMGTNISGGGPLGMTVDPSGTLLVCTGSEKAILSFKIDQRTGLLFPVTSAAVKAGGRNVASAIDPAGKFLYVPVEDADEVEVFAIDQATGKLMAKPQLTAHVGTSPASLGVTPNGAFLYVVNRGGATLSQFGINHDGSLTPMTNPIVSDPGVPWQILIDPSGQLAYVSNEQTALVTIYQIGNTGQLTPYSSTEAGPGAGGIGIARRHQ